MPIVVFADAPPRTREAAVELADYIEKIGGRRPAIIDGEPRPLPERAVWVGVQPAVKSLFPKYVLLLPGDAAMGFGSVLVICALASLIAIRMALKVDPAEAIGG